MINLSKAFFRLNITIIPIIPRSGVKKLEYWGDKVVRCRILGKNDAASDNRNILVDNLSDVDMIDSACLDKYVK